MLDFISFGIERAEPKMTCIVRAKNEKNVYIVSDSWNTNPINNHMIQKICVNKKHPIIIAAAGENSTKSLSTDKIVNVVDIMQKCCDSYNGINFNECFNTLKNDTETMINDMQIPPNSVEVFTQYFISYYDDNIKMIKNFIFEIRKTLNVNIGTEEISRYFINKNFCSLGRYSRIISSYKKNTSVDNLSLKEMKNSADLIVNKHIELEEKIYEPEIRTVGGPIQWASIDENGKLETNIDELEF